MLTFVFDLQIPMQYWMYDGYLENYTADYGLYNDLFGEEKTTFSKELKLQTNQTNTREFGAYATLCFSNERNK